MHKSLIIASTLALSLGAASAQTAAPATPMTPATTTATPAVTSQVTTFSDVPAGHWAKDAVDVITQRGLIQGFPDGTFRGNENLTRYQAALIFYRLLQTGALSNGSLSQTDLATITRGMQEVSTELAAISTRVTDLERLSAEQQARITALEERITALGTGSANTDVTALTARVDALEAAVQNIPAGPQGPAGPAGPQGPAGPAGAAAVTPAPVDTTTTGTVTTETPSTTVVIGDTTPAPVATRGNLYAGVSASASSGACYLPNASSGRAVNFCTSFGGMIGSTQIVGPIGARVAAEYKPGRNAISADVNAMYHLNTGTNIQPYAGVGLGLTSSTSRTATSNTTDTYVNALVGVDFQITNSISAFVEGNGRYYLSNKGTGALNTTGTADKGFAPSVKAGLKFFF
ncbi:S-layer protein [Deinococcus phoenicis]|uniref:S-layer protein n=1 Tax=Deinococcus phoenicis TaxID=1476583 RepID=A0A016QRN3_9DEIO|nr:S-layer homology domain-containing protein [Deinococcus phoenicis]EYB68723.1 S-layer protein [Deinococcus phoenicis]